MLLRRSPRLRCLGSFGSELLNRLTGGVEKLQYYIRSRLRLQGVVNDCAVRWIPSDRRSRGKLRTCAIHAIRILRAKQLRLLHDIHSTFIHHLMDERQIIKRNIETGFGSGVQQSTLVGILADDACKSRVWNPPCDLLPALTIVIRFIEIWLIIVPLIHRRRDIGSCRIVWRSFDRIDLYPFRDQILWGRHVAPVFAAVARNLYQSIIRARPNNTFLNRGLNYRKDGAVILNTRIVLSYRTAGRPLLRFIISCQVGTDHFPSLPLV